MPVSSGVSSLVRLGLPLLTASLLAGPLVAPVHAQGSTPTVVFTPFGILPDSLEYPKSEARGVSADGRVVVGSNYSYDSANGKELYHALRWSNGQVLKLGVIANYQGTDPGSLATGVSANGQVIVGNSSDQLYSSQAWRWESGKMVGLGVLPGDAGSVVAGVSADGKVVAGISRGANYHAFRWENGQMTRLNGLLGDSGEDQVTAISADGKVVVGGGTFNPGLPFRQAIRWANGQAVGLGYLPGHRGSYAHGVSDTGRVIVGMSDVVGGDKAVRWENGQIFALPDAPGGGTDYRAYSVSGDGQVIVGSDGATPFLWRADLGTVTLEDLVRAQSVTGMDGLSLSGIPVISADGSTIVGTTYNNNTYETRGFSIHASNPGGFRTLGYAGSPAVLGRVVLQGLSSVAATRSVNFELRPTGGGQPIAFTRDISTAREDQSFTFVVPGGTSGTFNLAIHAPGYLRTNVRVQIGTTGGAAIRDVTLLPGDVNGDNRINLTDLMQLRPNYGKSGVGLKGDLNGDGKVDDADIALIQQNFGRQGQQ